MRRMLKFLTELSLQQVNEGTAMLREMRVRGDLFQEVIDDPMTVVMCDGAFKSAPVEIRSKLPYEDFEAIFIMAYESGMHVERIRQSDQPTTEESDVRT